MWTKLYEKMVLPACDDVSGDEDDGGDEHQHRDHQGHHKQTHLLRRVGQYHGELHKLVI